MPVVLQPQVSHSASKTVEDPRSQFIDRFAPPVITQVNLVTMNVETAPIQHFEKVVEVPCRDSADPVHQQGGRGARGDATTGTSGSDCAGDGDSPDGAVRRQSGGRTRDHAGHAVGAQCDRGARGDATTGTSDSTGLEDHGSPAVAVHMSLVILQITQVTKHAEIPPTH